MMNEDELKDFLDYKTEQFNRPGFIENDPISIPHLFSKKQDIEISGFFAALLAWGQRVTILNNCRRLMQLMDNSPYQFITGHSERDLQKMSGFVHRTFNETDLLYFIHFFRNYYSRYDSLEQAFAAGVKKSDITLEQGLNGFREEFLSHEDTPLRTRKHISSPAQKSACKRLNMYLRWMVRNDGKGVDFGIWNELKPSQLLCPLDLHVSRTARSLGLISRKQDDWGTVTELTGRLRAFDPSDPVKYDFALYGLGVIEGFNKNIALPEKQ